MGLGSAAMLVFISPSLSLVTLRYGSSCNGVWRLGIEATSSRHELLQKANSASVMPWSNRHPIPNPHFSVVPAMALGATQYSKVVKRLSRELLNALASSTQVSWLAEPQHQCTPSGPGSPCRWCPDVFDRVSRGGRG